MVGKRKKCVIIGTDFCTYNNYIGWRLRPKYTFDLRKHGKITKLINMSEHIYIGFDNKICFFLKFKNISDYNYQQLSEKYEKYKNERNENKIYYNNYWKHKDKMREMYGHRIPLHNALYRLPMQYITPFKNTNHTPDFQYNHRNDRYHKMTVFPNQFNSMLYGISNIKWSHILHKNNTNVSYNYNNNRYNNDDSLLSSQNCFIA